LRTIRKLYGSSAQTGQFPLHQRLRFVPAIQDLVSGDSLTKAQELRNRQAGWNKQHNNRTTADFTVIDCKMKNSELTLRNMIMTTKATTGNTKTPLFQSLDASMRGAGFVLSFHPDNPAQACMTIKGLYPRLLVKYGIYNIATMSIFFFGEKCIEGRV
jgi:hypothetical protein